MKVCRAWLEAKGRVVESLAINRTVQISPTAISATFKAEIKSAELDAIASNTDYGIDENVANTQTLQAKPSGRVSRLKLEGNSQFTLDKEGIGQAIAWYLYEENSKGEGSGLEIVSRNDVLTDDQIAINPAGQIYVSKNLIGKVIKVRASIILPRQVTLLSGKMDSVNFHCVYLDTGKFHYSKFTGNVVTPDASLPNNSVRVVKLTDIQKERSEILCSN